MTWETLYIIFLLGLLSSSFASAVYVWISRPMPGSRMAGLLALGAGVWLSGYIMELQSIQVGGKMFWNQVQYVGIVIVPAAWLLFALRYTCRERSLSPAALALLVVEPLIVLTITFTNEAHGLMWEPGVFTFEGPFSVLSRPHGAGYGFHAIYSYALYAAAISLFIRRLVHSLPLERRQLSALIFAASLPLLAYLIGLLDLHPPHLDLTPLAVAASSQMVIWGIFYLQSQDVVPVTRSMIFDSMSDGVIVLDEQERVAVMNPIAQHIVGRTEPSVVGQPLEKVWPVWPGRHSFSGNGTGMSEIGLSEGNGRLTYDVRISSIANGGEHPAGKVIVLRDVTQRKQTEEEKRRIEERIQRQHEMLIQLTTHPALAEGRLEEALQVIAEATSGTLEVEEVRIWRLSLDSSHLHCLEAYERSTGSHSMGQRIPAEESPRYLKASGEYLDPALTTTDYGSSAVNRRRLEAPIRLHGEVVGMVSYKRNGTPSLWTPDEVSFASQVADLVAQTFLTADIRSRAQRMAVVNRIARAAGATRNLDELLETVYEEVVPIFRPDAFFIALYDEEMNELDFRIRLDGGVRRPAIRRPLESRLTAVICERRSLLISDLEQERDFLPAFQNGEMAKPAASWLVVPMEIGDRAIGVICVQSYEPYAYGQEEQLLLYTIADQVAVGVENARLFQAEREQRELAEALEETARVVNSTLDLDQVMGRILEQVERVVVGDAFNIMLIEDGIARVARSRGYERFGAEEIICSVSFQLSETGDLKRVAQTGEPFLIPDVDEYPQWIEVEGMEWLHSYIVVPICVTGETVGFLNVDGTRPGQFCPDDARRLSAFASHVATAIENARLYQEQREYAEQLERRVEERTAEVHAQYARSEAILLSTADGIIVTDPEGTILHLNPIARAWLEQTLLPEDAACLKETVCELAEQAEEQPETVLELKGLDLELRAAPVVGEGVEEATVVVAAHDISHLKALDRMKTRFVSNVSHELRTPVAAIKLYAALMHRKPDRWEEYLDLLAHEADHQAQLVEDILQISRIDAGRLEMNPSPTPLNELGEAVAATHRVLAQEKGLQLEYHPAQPGPVALIDAEQVVQVINNLVRNAIQYTPAGGEVEIVTGRVRAEGRTWATLAVSDTGMGIPEEECLRVFERFFRGEQPQLMQISGTGLGLAIVKEIVELHGGRVTVESEVDVGTTFHVWLPLVE
jgi:signal transduction histidine kinase